jgi:hypothetical protein
MDRLSVATSANVLGAGMAAAATAAGADRIFLMGYDYRVAGSEPGAVSPLERRDGDERDLSWSLDLYATFGVPVERTLLGLPLYGRTWPVSGPELGAPATGRGVTWVPRRNLELLLDPAVVPVRDEIEMVELYALAADGAPRATRGSPDAAPAATDPAASDPAAPSSPGTWRAVYVDSPATLAPKLALANERGLAGAGFWAIGYERGLPAYTDLIARFAAGGPLEEGAGRPGDGVIGYESSGGVSEPGAASRVSVAALRRTRSSSRVTASRARRRRDRPGRDPSSGTGPARRRAPWATSSASLVLSPYRRRA